MFTNRIAWGILLVAWMAGSTWWHVCKIKLLCADSPLPTVVTPASPAPAPTASVLPALVVTDGNQFRFAAPGNVSFAKSGAVANRRGVGTLPDSLTAYLTANPGKTIIISGYYAPDEQNPTTFPNLGIARANDLKQWLLTKQGLSDGLIITTGVKAEDLAFSAKGDSIYGGIAINFGSTDTIATTPAPIPASSASTSLAADQPLVLLTEPITEADLAKKETFTSVFQPIDLYFLLGEVDHINTEETTKFLREAETYLARHKDKKLVLTGHTDNSGPDASNLELSRARANSVRSRLRKSGIDAGQIQVDARGEEKPKADNSTLSGRKANRRVTVVVQ
ncbi:MAG: OmpA family protein [Bacteroidetes bacterium]|nr:OmpA family protein [Fibrella sp.]